MPTSTTAALLKSKYEDFQAHKRRNCPNLWSDIRELVCLFTVILSYLLVSYMAIFDYRHTENIPILVLIYTCDLVYFVDIILRICEMRAKSKRELAYALNRTIFGQAANASVTEPPSPAFVANLEGIRASKAEKLKKRARRLVSRSFWKKYVTFVLDALSMLPMELLVLIISLKYQPENKKYMLILSCLKLNRLLRLYRVSNYYRTKIREIRVNLTRREIVNMSVCFISFLVILFHGIACMWYRLSCDGVYETNEPVSCYELGETEYSNGTTGYRPVFSPEEGAWGIYVSQIHWAVTSLRNSGNRYDPPVTAPQLVLAMFIQVFGFLMCTGIMMVAIYLSSQIDLKRAIFFHEAYGASTFVKHFKMSRTVIKFLNSCYNFMWKHHRSFTDYNIRPVLCRTMRTQLLMSIFEPMMQASELLKCFSREELERLALDVQYKHYFANEFIVRPNTIGHNIFYVVQGSVEIMSDEDPTLAIMTLNSGSLIGEVNIVFPTRRVNGVKTRTPSDILMLPFASVMSVGKFDVRRLEQMTSIIKYRMNWLAEENEKKFEEELELIKKQQAQRAGGRKKSVSGHSGGSSESMLDPMEVLLYRRQHALSEVRGSDATANPPGPGAGAGARARRKSSGPNRKPKGAQFMSVLAWLNFYKWERKRRTTKSSRYDDIYARMHPQFRNEASAKMYNVIETLPSIPKYIWKSATVSKESNLYAVWEFFVTLIIAMYAFAYPIEIMMANSHRTISDVFNTIVEIVYALDLILRLGVFMDVDEIVPELSSLSTHILHEFRTVDIWFDLLPVLPIHHFASLNMRTTQFRLYLYARFPMYALKSTKLFLFIRSWENNVRMNVTVVRTLKHLLYISLYIVWLGSTFTWFGCPNFPNCFHKHDMNLSHTGHHHRSATIIINETWVDKFLKHRSNAGYDIGNFKAAFPLSAFWAVCAIFGIQFDIMTPATRDETALQTIGLLAGFALIIYFCSDLAATIAGFVENKINHVDKVVWIKNYMDGELIALRLIDRVTHYMNLQWKALRGLSSESSNTSGFLSPSHTMNIELMVHIVGECLLNAYFFQNMDTELLRKFALSAIVAVIPPNEEILKSGDLVARMYIIRRGYVQVYYRNTNIKMDLLTSGQSFGEVYMFHGTLSRVTCRAVTYVEIIMLDSRSFEKILPLSKIHQEELWKIKEDKEGLLRFNAALDDIVETLADPDLRHHEYKPPPVDASPFKRFRTQVTRVNSRGIPVTTFEPRPSYERVFEQHKWCKWARKLLLPLTYTPDGKFLLWWERFRVLTICLLIVLVPPVEAYPDFKESSQLYVYILDVFTFIDMYIRAHIAYYDSRTHELISHPLRTSKHYLASGFLADFLGSLPVYAIIDVAFSGSALDTSLFAFIMRLNRLVLIYRVVGFYLYKSQGRASIGMPIRKMVMLLPLLLFHIHIVACMASVLACPSSMKAWDEMRAIHPAARCYKRTWVTLSKHRETSKNLTSFHLYIHAFYYIGTTSIGLGFGDFKPSNHNERMFATVLFFCYVFALTYLLATFAGSRSHIDYKLLRFQQQMKYLVGFIAHEKLETKLAGRIIRHYNYEWLRTRGIEPQRLFSNLFPALRKEVALDVFEDVFGQVSEFKGITESFLRTICVYMVPIYFLRRDVIVRRSDICDTIFFVFRGKVAASRDEYDEETVLERGTIIGILNPMLKNPVYDRTIVSVTNVDMFAIPRKDFIRAMQAYPEVCDRFKARNLALAKEVKEVGVELAEYEAHIQARREAKRRARASRQQGRHVSINASPSKGPGNLQQEMKDEEQGSDHEREHESTSEIRSTYSEFAVNMVLQEEQDPNAKYDEDTLYAQSILPGSRCVRFMSVLVLLCSCLSASLAFYQYTFEAYHPAFFSIGYACDIVFIVKICMSFRVSYFNEQGDVIVDSTEISNKYLSEMSGFSLDFFSLFPSEIFASLALASAGDTSPTVYFWWTALRLNRLSRLIHVVQFYKRRTSAFLVHLIPVKLERILIATLIYIHFMACILYSNTGFVKLKHPCDCRTATVCRTKPSDLEVWFQTKNIGKGSRGRGSHLPCHKYTLSLYFVVTTFTTTSYADVFPVSVFEMLFTTVLAYSSKVWFCLVLSDIMSGLQNNVDLSYHLAADGVLSLYKDYGVPRPVLEKAADYFNYAWTQNRGILFPDFLSRAPASLKMDICAKIYGDHFRKSYLFRDLPDSFIRQACIRLVQEWIIAGDYVIHQGEIDDKLYFIHHGIVDYTREDPVPGPEVAPDAKEPQPGTSAAMRKSIRRQRRRYRTRAGLNHGYMSKSKHFGEIQGFLGPAPHTCSYRAETNVDVVSLSHADIEDLFKMFPEYQATVMRRFRGKYTPLNTSEREPPARPAPKLKHIHMVRDVDGNLYPVANDEPLIVHILE